MFEKHNGVYIPTEHEVVKTLPIGLYNLQYNSRKYCAEVKYITDQFNIPKRLYCLDRPFVERVKKTFQRQDRHLGVLLNGYKGSGKSMLAKVLCNELNLPIFVLNEVLDGDEIQVFCAALNQDCVIFLDEYEKVFGRDGKLLSLMDGSLNLNCKILFLLTSNEMEINDNLLNRPSRIFFVKQFKGLEPSECEEIVSDFIEDKEMRERVLNIVSNFEEVTIDNIMTFLQEVLDTTDPVEKVIEHMNIKMKAKSSTFGISRK